MSFPQRERGRQHGTRMYTENVFEIPYNGKRICNHDTESAVLLPLPPLPKNREIRPAHHHQHHEVSSNPNEMLSNLRANLSVHASDFGATIHLHCPSFKLHLDSWKITNKFFYQIIFMMNYCQCIHHPLSPQTPLDQTTFQSGKAHHHRNLWLIR